MQESVTHKGQLTWKCACSRACRVTECLYDTVTVHLKGIVDPKLKGNPFTCHPYVDVLTATIGLHLVKGQYPFNQQSGKDATFNKETIRQSNPKKV